AVGGPLQGDVHAGAVLEHQELIPRGEELAHAAGEVLVAGERGHHLGGGARVGGVAGDEAGEGRGDEGGALIGVPVLGEDPAHAGGVGGGVLDIGGAAPGVELDLVHV